MDVAPEPRADGGGIPWPASLRRGRDGGLELAGHPLAELAEAHGTPVYLLDVADLLARARDYVTAFDRSFADLGGAEVYYAGKAFLSVAIARWLHAEGMGIDVASGPELAVALSAGVEPEAITLHGNNKSPAELERAVAAGVGRIVVDSLSEVDLLAEVARRHGRRVPVLVRITTGVHAGGHEFIATAHEDQKFGLSLRDGSAMAGVAAVLSHPELKLCGLHSHLGSQILDMAGFGHATEALLQLREDIATSHDLLVEELGVGGGFGISYTGQEQPLAPDEVAAHLAEVLREACHRLQTTPPRVSVEPGRSVIGPAGVTLYRVGTTKAVTRQDGGTRRYISVDGGMSDNIRTALYDADYTAALANRRHEPPAVDARVVGMHCESGDIVVRDVAMPHDITRGDLLAVPATGAYGRAMASNYNLVPRPGVLAVSHDEVRFILRPETEEDVLALDEG